MSNGSNDRITEQDIEGIQEEAETVSENITAPAFPFGKNASFKRQSAWKPKYPSAEHVVPTGFDSAQEFIEVFVRYLINKNQYEFISLMMRNIPTHYWDTDILLTILKSTYHVKDFIPFRMAFYYAVENALQQRRDVRLNELKRLM